MTQLDDDRGSHRADGIAGSDNHRPRHSRADPDEIMTSIIPRVALPLPDFPTTVLPAVPPQADVSRESTPSRETGAEPPPETEKGVKVVPLRPVRTEEGYRSVYSEHTRTTPATVVRGIMRGTGEVLITFGLIVLLFAAYEVWGKAAIVDAHQQDLDQQLAQDWGGGPPVAPTTPDPSGSPSPTASVPAPPSGRAIARLYVPKINKTLAVVEGVTPDDIRYAPGHYPNSAMPGEVGNFSVAGHRNRSIFWDLDKLKVGDPIVVETASEWFVYKVTQNHIVLPTAVAVVAPVPNKPGAKATEAMLTLTTCNPKFDNYQRLIVHAQLDHSQPHAERPAEIGG